jgi:hypothetical protein
MSWMMIALIMLVSIKNDVLEHTAIGDLQETLHRLDKQTRLLVWRKHGPNR